MVDSSTDTAQLDSGTAEGQTEQISESAAGSEPKNSKPSLLDKFKSLTKIRIRVERAEGAAAAKKEKKKKAKPEKKPKEKKKAKPKAKKPKKTAKPKKASDKNGGGKNRRLIILIAVAVALIVAGVVIFFLTRKPPATPESLLEEAAVFTAELKYAEAAENYNLILEWEDAELEQETLVLAYLGLAENYTAQELPEDAAATLLAGFERTQDPRLAPPSNPDDPAAPQPSVPVVWTDPAMEAMMRIALDIPAPQVISTADLDAVTSLKIVGNTHAVVNKTLETLNKAEGYTIDGTLYTEYGSITSLADLKNFKNLQRLTVSYNHITDIRGIESLPLERLGLYFNDIRDLSPLSGLSEMRHLFLYNNQIEDLSPLAQLSNLDELWLQYNQISDLTPLSKLQRLRVLYIGNNLISDITPIRSMTNLELLFADNNKITDTSVVREMPKLSDSSFKNNP